MPLSLRLTACVLVSLAGLLSASAHAQLAGSLALTTDDRFRGLSRSDGEPSARLGLNLDTPGGWYAGAALSRASLWPGHRTAQWTAYGGHSQRLTASWAWELGAIATHFASTKGYDYAELYAGLLGEPLQARLYLSPDYYGRNGKSAYAELNARWPLAEGLHLLAHAGVLGMQRPGYGRRLRADLRLGAAYSVSQAELMLDWSGAQRDSPYPAAYGGERSGWSLSLAFYF